jgi:hypothetical protein
MHLEQPLARLIGRITHGLTPWRRSARGLLALPRAVDAELWRETWHAPESWISELAGDIRGRGLRALSGGDFDEWDLEARAGALGGARIVVAIEEHGQGRQLARVRARGRASGAAVTVSSVLLAAAVGAGFAGAIVACIVLSLAGAAGIRHVVLDVARSLDAVREALASMEKR